MHDRYITPKGDIKISFLNIQDLSDGKAETIHKAIESYCDQKQIDLRKCMGFG